MDPPDSHLRPPERRSGLREAGGDSWNAEEAGDSPPRAEGAEVGSAWRRFQLGGEQWHSGAQVAKLGLRERHREADLSPPSVHVPSEASTSQPP